MKSWHSAKLLFEAKVGGVVEDDGLREESIRVLLAESKEEALSQAEQLGRDAEHEYVNDAAETVRWCFIEVLEVQDLCESELKDGMEVFATLLRGASTARGE